MSGLAVFQWPSSVELGSVHLFGEGVGMVLRRGIRGYGRVRLWNEVSVGATAIDQLMSS
jgi:hypothetical protein